MVPIHRAFVLCHQLLVQLAGKTRTREKYRTVYNERQKKQLEQQYIANTYISPEQKTDIARAVGLTERQVKIWFQNRRAKDRRQKYQSSDEDQSTPQHHSQQQQQQQFGCVFSMSSSLGLNDAVQHDTAM